MTDTPRKDKGKAMKPPADATHCGGYLTGTLKLDLTAPEAIGFWVHRVGQDDYVRLEQFVALSAKLDAAEAESANDKLDIATLRTQVSALRTTCARVKAERDAALANLTALQNDEWSDKPDNLTPSIVADFGSDGFHDRYAQAIEMVSNRHSKGALVSLVAFLLAARQKGGEG